MSELTKEEITMENLGNSMFEPVVPAKVTPWSKVKNFLFQEITVTMTPKQEKVLQEVHDFWHQELNRDFWFQEIKIVDNITL